MIWNLMLHRRMCRALIIQKENVNDSFCILDAFYKMLKHERLLSSTWCNVEKMSRKDR